LSPSTKYDSSRVQRNIETVTKQDREVARGLRVMLEKIEALDNPLEKAFAVKLFCDILDILASKPSWEPPKNTHV